MNDKAIYSADDLNILKRENQSLRSELQKQKEEIANHIAVNSLLTDSEGEVGLANKLYQCQSELAKQKELNAELVKGMESLVRLFYAGYTIYPKDLQSLIKKSNPTT